VSLLTDWHPEYCALCGVHQSVRNPDCRCCSALERARVVGVLDGWRQVAGRTWTLAYRDSCILRAHDMATGAIVGEHVFDGQSPDKARAAAAKAIEAGEV